MIRTAAVIACVAFVASRGAQAQNPADQPRLLADALTTIERNYGARPDYPRLLGAAMRGLARALPPGLFKPVREGNSMAVETSVPKTAALVLMRPQNTVELRREIMEGVRFATRLSPSVELPQLEQSLLVDMVSELDPGSSFLTGEAYRTISTGASLGAELALEGGTVRVVAPHEGSAAELAGLRPGDAIMRIDGTALKDKTVQEVLVLLRGAPDSRMRLDIARPGEKEPRQLELAREAARIAPVRSKLLEPGVAWVRIPQFEEQTYPAFVTQVNALYAAGAPKGIVLDLRNAHGNLVASAVSVASGFLPRGTAVAGTVTRRFRRFGTPQVRGDALNEETRTVPLVVLVNGGTAASAELLAAALQDNKRAVIVGTRTFGKGSVQAIFPIAGGEAALRLTTSRFQTPRGAAIEGKGISPDVAGEERDGARPSAEYGTEKDVELRRAVTVLKSADGAPAPGPSS